MSYRLTGGLIVLLYLLLAMGYGLVNPLFEAPDEHWHYFTAQYVAENGRLPHVGDKYDEWLSQQAAQPPLYYLLGSLLIRPINTGDARDQVWLNPFAAIGDASQTTNINRMVHGPWEEWPWQGYALAAHLLRFMSTLMGLGTLLLAATTARLLWPEQPQRALLAMALLAVWPQFLFLHASVTNDALMTLLASAGLYQLLWLWQREVSRKRLLLLGLTLGLAALSKNAGVLLLIYSMGILALLAWRNGRFQLIPQSMAYVLLPALLLAGWLWWRNWLLYADPLATEPFIRLAGGDRGYTLWQVLAESGGLWQSLFAIFGWFNLRPPDWVHGVWSVLTITAILGMGHRLVVSAAEPLTQACGEYSRTINADIISLRNARLHQIPSAILHKKGFTAVLLAGWLLVVYTGLIAFMLRTEAAQGRLLFPAILPLVLGLAYGLSQLPRRLAGLAPALGLVTAVYCLFFVIRPAYALPPMLAQLPAAAVPLHADVGQGLTLAGVQMETETAAPGELLWLTLYWQTAATPTEPPEFVLELLGRDLVRVGHLHSYHGRGLYPATLWPVDKIIADRFAMPVDETAVTPVLARAFAGLAAAEARVAVGEVKLAPAQWPQAGSEVLAVIGETGEVVLAETAVTPTTVRPGQQIQVDLTWRVASAPAANWTTFLHLAEAGRPPLAQGDAPPLQGYYPTRVWEADEVIVDHYWLTVPDGVENGRYPLWVGMYDNETIARLPLSSEGQPQPHNAFLLAWIMVER
jgi:4-amino-4-deoxy-L-arabinose transferase-like glycosyltransferase